MSLSFTIVSMVFARQAAYCMALSGESGCSIASRMIESTATFAPKAYAFRDRRSRFSLLTMGTPSAQKRTPGILRGTAEGSSYFSNSTATGCETTRIELHCFIVVGHVSLSRRSWLQSGLEHLPSRSLPRQVPHYEVLQIHLAGQYHRGEECHDC